ncbi:hypothetical protein HG535_0F03990 [Zygotorulaspora mrakii]|uniref:Uncharacterized protein n=1 Tax=Zygotorulaspora mrakii TaxID=42260 RepID=A0A7H9B5S5_ZYGMR|nr:uncharacterized protein HG535_0F03990 [Zygotorulaspora mrakii]QLG73887.1 hypothetical protein HG535_0F03990 [Zygotorulaspora mrakii]
MNVIHPFQAVVSNASGNQIYVVSKSTILAYKYDGKEYRLIGKWVDEVEGNHNHAPTESKNAKSPSQAKKMRSNGGKSSKKYTSDPLFPIITSQIRKLRLSSDESKLIACTDSDKSIIILRILLEGEYEDNCLKLTKRQPFPKRPNALTITDREKLIIADKFGDVYEMDAYKDDVQEIKEPILGHVSMLTDILFVRDLQGNKYIITSDRDEHIKISHYPQCYVVDKWLFGHKQFISSLCNPIWKSQWLFSAGGDECVFAWDWINGEKLAEFNYEKLIQPHLSAAHLASERFQNESNDIIEYAVSTIVSLHTLPFVAFFVEATNILIILEVCPNTGVLSLKETLELPYSIVSLSESHDELEVTCDNRSAGSDHFVEFITHNKQNNCFEIDTQRSDSFNRAVALTLKDEESVNVGSDDIYPLYNMISLKKHGEHYS